MRILSISHVNNGLKTGAGVYTLTVNNMLKTAYPDSKLVMIYAVDKNSFIFRTYRKIISLIKFFSGSKTSKEYYFKTPHLFKVLKEKIRQDWDLVVIEHAEMLWITDYFINKCKIIHVSHNVEHLLYEEYLKKKKSNPFLSYLIKKDVPRYKQLELQYMKKIKHIISISEDDIDYFKSILPELNIYKLPPVFDYNHYQYIYRKRAVLRLGYLANMRWWPNRNGINWFLSNVLPLLKIPYEIHIFGRESQKLNNKFPSVYGHGFIKDATNIWDMCDIMINPILDGGGVSVKVAESIYNSMPMICTSRALKGLRLCEYNKSYINIADTPSEWASIISSIASGDILITAQDKRNMDIFSKSYYFNSFYQFLKDIMKQES